MLMFVFFRTGPIMSSMHTTNVIAIRLLQIQIDWIQSANRIPTSQAQKIALRKVVQKAAQKAAQKAVQKAVWIRSPQRWKLTPMTALNPKAVLMGRTLELNLNRNVVARRETATAHVLPAIRKVGGKLDLHNSKPTWANGGVFWRTPRNVIAAQRPLRLAF